MSDRKSALAEQQNERILSAAKTCFVARGLAHTTMRDIASTADMSLGNIYRYFKNKEALIEAFIEADDQQIGEAFALLDNAKDFKVTLKEIGGEIIKEIANKAELLLYTDILSEALRDEKIMSIVTLDNAERSLAEKLENASKDQRVQLPLTVETTALAIMSFVENAALKCVINKKYSVRTAKKQFKQYIDLVIDK